MSSLPRIVIVGAGFGGLTAARALDGLAVDLTVVDSNGRDHALHADVMRVIPGGANPGGTIVNEGLARWTHEGMTGYGIAEYLHQFHDDGSPVVPIE